MPEQARSSSRAPYASTTQGRDPFEQLVRLRRERLTGLLGDLSPERHQEVVAALGSLARERVSESPRTAV